MGCTQTIVQDSQMQLEAKQVKIDNNTFLVPDKQATMTAFRALDTNKSGKLDPNEILELFKTLGRPLEKEEFNKVLTLADQDIDACLDENEFYHLMYILSNSDFNDKEKIVFLMTDINCSGTIDSKELSLLLKKLEITASQEKIEELVTSIADNADGTLSYNMFMALLAKLAE
ncbi:EF_hand domain-containing protein [Hexamita inflata]|uniref:EF_hand domain-containing protein n=1 Tax=Hexamita inflata TaxID=28002 RepID=A0ABP1HP83_9EUKA